MNIRLSVTLITVFLLNGCVAYTVVTPGPVTVGAMTVDTAEMWNAAPGGTSAANNPNTQIWTSDGLLLDRIVIIPGVPDGQTIFSYAMPIARRLACGAVVLVEYESGPSRTTKSQIRACELGLIVISRVESLESFVA